MSNYSPESYLLKNMKQVKSTPPRPASKQQRDLLVCSLTVQDIHDLLSDHKVNLGTDIPTNLIHQILSKDLERVIEILMEYSQTQPEIREAIEWLHAAVRELYFASQISPEDSRLQQIKWRTAALQGCRNKLQQTYIHLERSSRPQYDSAPRTYDNALPDDEDRISADEVLFTAFHPKEGKVDSWYTLLVYAHLLSALRVVYEDAKRWNDPWWPMAKVVQTSAATRIARGTELTIIPACDGITFNPPRMNISWLEDYHRIPIRFRADQSLFDFAAKGYISILIGPLIIATLKFAMLFGDQGEVSAIDEEQHSRMYHQDKIFISYSHKDSDIVQAFKKVHQATGYDVLIDTDNLRSGQEWNPELMRMIDRADIFQLFWSTNSQESKYCEQEWRHALRRATEGFIRPVYWQTPMPNPPRELSKYHFEYVEL